MQRLTAEQFAELTRDAQVLSRDEFGDKVLRRSDGTVIKLFRRKRLLSSALLWPYAVRFAHAARKLTQRGFVSVEVTGLYWVPSIQRHVVTYPFVAGETLRDLLNDSCVTASRRQQLLESFAEFVSRLHQQGVYFRAIHFGNVLVQSKDSMSLIDVSEASFRWGALSLSLRARNFRPMTRYREDLRPLLDFGVDKFMDRYGHHSNLSERERRVFANKLKASCPQLSRGTTDTLSEKSAA